MMMKQALVGAITLALCGFSMAQDAPTTTLTLVLPGPTLPAFWVGSVVNVNPAATTFAISCLDPPKDEEEFCNKHMPYTMVHGPKTYSGENVINDLYTQRMGCDVEGTTRAVCSATEVPLNPNQASFTTRPERFSTIDPGSFTSVPLPITAGAAKLDATANPTSPPEGTPDGTSSGLAPKATGAAKQWAVGGMAAAALAAAI